MSNSNCCFLTSIQVSQETGKVFFSSHLCKNFFTVCCDQQSKAFLIFNEAEVDVFSGIFLLLYDPENVAIGSLVPLPFLNPACSSVNSQYMHC